MNNQQKQLQSVLQALALPVTGQLRLYPYDDCKVNRMIQEYEQIEPSFLAGWQHCLTGSQEAALALLRRDLTAVCHGMGEMNHTCTDMALRRSAKWRQIRLLARRALLAFNWPFLNSEHLEPMLLM